VTAIKISEDVLRVLDAATIAGNLVTLNGQLDRALYSATNKVLEAAGGKWNRRAKAHIFDGPAIETIEPILETGEYRRVKQDFGQFDTPPDLVARVIAEADLHIGQKILDPSAGAGNIVAGIIDRLGTGADIFAFEIDEKRLATCRTRNFRAFGAGGLVLGNFLAAIPDPTFDRVLMNPPFAGQADIDHVRHAARFLRPGGRLVAIMSGGVLFRSNRKMVEFRAFVEQRGGRIEKLPDEAFKAAGTSVSTCIVSFNV
jgi:predicted RNA methylase